jgi:hypothetical protein
MPTYEVELKAKVAIAMNNPYSGDTTDEEWAAALICEQLGVTRLNANAQIVGSKVEVNSVRKVA